MKKKCKNKLGITLLSLIITIIVIFLLAGIVLNMAFGKNGIVENTNKVIQQYTDSINTEQKTMNEIEKELIKEIGE